jgi:hypothetical protein
MHKGLGLKEKTLTGSKVVEEVESQGWRRHEGEARVTPLNFVDQGANEPYATVSGAKRNAAMRNLSTAR